MFTLDGHWGWVWAAYAVGSLAFGGLALGSLRRLAAARRRLAALETAREERA